MGHQDHDEIHPVPGPLEDSRLGRSSDGHSSTEPPDGELAAAACAGDESAFEILFERHRRRVGIIAGRFFQKQEEIEDVVQECFTKAYFALAGFSDEREGSLAAWLSRIAFNICYDELRKRRRRPESGIGELTAEELQTVGRLCAESSDESIESATVSRDLANKLLSRLSAEDRVVLVLLEVEGLSVAEIGKAMSWSSSKVKIRVFRARSELRRLLEKFL